jgi:hypothetical protein
MPSGRSIAIGSGQGRSLSAVVADLTIRGLAQLNSPAVLSTDQRSGLPVLSIGRSVTSDEVAAALDDE